MNISSKKNEGEKEKVLVTLTEVKAYKKIKDLLPEYKMSFSEFVDEMNVSFVDAVENNDGHLDLTIVRPGEAIIKNKSEVEDKQS